LRAPAVLIVNNVCVIDTDRRVGKRTLAVALGRRRARRLYALTVLLAYAITILVAASGEGPAWILLSLLSAPLAPPLMRTVTNRRDGPSLNAALAGTGRLLAVYSVLLSLGLLLSG